MPATSEVSRMTARAVRERPIIFGAAMVRAILEDRKWMTRRVVKPAPNWGNWPHRSDDEWLCAMGGDRRRCPYGKPGEHLWVREAWAFFDRYASRSEAHNGPETPKTLPAFCGDSEQGKAVMAYWKRRLLFRADGPHPHIDWDVPWRSPIHMPRWASRITLEITGVRVERLNEISEADAKAEGIERDGDGWREYRPGYDCFVRDEYPVHSFKSLWESLHGPGSFDSRFVWVIEFRRCGGC
jgi:hypothetical protein